VAYADGATTEGVTGDMTPPFVFVFVFVGVGDAAGVVAPIPPVEPVVSEGVVAPLPAAPVPLAAAGELAAVVGDALLPAVVPVVTASLPPPLPHAAQQIEISPPAQVCHRIFA
jgi:hypothetical protein